MIERMIERANASERMRQRARFVDLAFEIDMSDQRHLVIVSDGRFSIGNPGQAGPPFPAFAIRGERSVWEAYASATPPRLQHDLFALSESGKLRIEGDPLPLLRYLMLVQLLLLGMRERPVA